MHRGLLLKHCTSNSVTYFGQFRTQYRECCCSWIWEQNNKAGASEMDNICKRRKKLFLPCLWTLTFASLELCNLPLVVLWSHISSHVLIVMFYNWEVLLVNLWLTVAAAVQPYFKVKVLLFHVVFPLFCPVPICWMKCQRRCRNNAVSIGGANNPKTRAPPL